MADQASGTPNGGTATPTANPAPSQPAPTFQVPDGKVLVDRAEYETHKRYEEQVKGFTPFYERARKTGFTKPEDFDGVEPLLKTLKERKLTPEQARRAFFEEIGQDDPQKNGDGGQPAFDQAAFEAGLERKFDVKLASKDHESAVKSIPAMLETSAKEALGKGATEYDIKNFQRALTAELVAHREANPQKHMYPDGHPLRDSKWAPYSKEVVAEVVTALKKERADFEAAKKVKTAEAIKTGTSVASPNSGGGTPQNSDGRRPGGKPSLDAVRANAEARMAKRGG